MSENVIVSKGKLYEEFKRTLFYEDLKRFLDEQIGACKDQAVKQTVEGNYEEAKRYAHKLSGYQSVIEYIEESIAKAIEVQSDLEDDLRYQKEIPSHV